MRYNKLILLSFILSALAFFSIAQSPVNLTKALSVNYSMHDYNTISYVQQNGLRNFIKSQDLFSLKKMSPAVAVSYLYPLTFKTDIIVTAAINFKKENPLHESGRMAGEWENGLQYKFLKPAALLQPYIYLGTGINFNKTSKVSMYIPGGPGLKLNLSGETSIFINTQYRRIFNNDVKNMLLYQIGISGKIGSRRSKKTVVNHKAYMAYQPVAIVDSDKDGLPDFVDRCPLIRGDILAGGCMPSDRDNDGINDRRDLCADVPGLAINNGCPVKLPQPLPVFYSRLRVPDTETDIQEKVTGLEQLVYFETNRYGVLPHSVKALDELFNILTGKPQILLIIEGHTDNTGTGSKNIWLSQKRANAIKDYLVNKGIAVSRITTRGYGASRPVATNDTGEGKAKNRRVNFIVEY